MQQQGGLFIIKFVIKREATAVPQVQPLPSKDKDHANDWTRERSISLSFPTRDDNLPCSHNRRRLCLTIQQHPAVTPYDPHQRNRDTHGQAQRDGLTGSGGGAHQTRTQKAKCHHQILKSCSHSRGRPRVVHTKTNQRLLLPVFLLFASAFETEQFVLLSGPPVSALLYSCCPPLFFPFDKIMWTSNPAMRLFHSCILLLLSPPCLCCYPLSVPRTPCCGWGTYEGKKLRHRFDARVWIR
ncbi:hypothetical protein AUEXF2481DRAFT_332847 [Aureobasidium subglaciale EXF-2481]|uniref:Uncharacterized protein n=1 Tax=Aureobasidium subglaciale (strain EXF-2481) TaxID=1043005 RepID=A0A074YGN0_AURSE|nr:uncharacterized protein AUEXF2481DRAFT_332847 [Aureobasidium subglaciale EXF-2481]KEQ93242.1 hypothetical protein AUEXF2481DRAFT_332847 [Aureobasidium subglaciale EXF-2481]